MANPNPFSLKHFKSRLRKKGVWLSILVGLVPLVLNAFGIALPVDYNEIVYTALSILVALGILSNPDDENDIKRPKPKDDLPVEDDDYSAR